MQSSPVHLEHLLSIVFPSPIFRTASLSSQSISRVQVFTTVCSLFPVGGTNVGKVSENVEVGFGERGAPASSWPLVRMIIAPLNQSDVESQHWIIQPSFSSPNCYLPYASH